MKTDKPISSTVRMGRPSQLRRLALWVPLLVCVMMAPGLWQERVLAQHHRRGPGSQPAGPGPMQPLSLPPLDDDDDMGMGPPPRHLMDPKAEEETLREFFPEQAGKMRALREKNPKEYARLQGQMRPWLGRLRDARQRDPELAGAMAQRRRMEMAIHEWLRRYHDTAAAQRSSLMPEGRALIEQLVDLRMRINGMEIRMLQQRLEALKARLAERENKREEIIDRDLSNLVNPPTSQPVRPGHRNISDSK